MIHLNLGWGFRKTRQLTAILLGLLVWTCFIGNVQAQEENGISYYDGDGNYHSVDGTILASELFGNKQETSFTPTVTLTPTTTLTPTITNTPSPTITVPVGANADLNSDGIIDFSDMVLFAGSFKLGSGDNGYLALANIDDSNNFIDTTDRDGFETFDIIQSGSGAPGPGTNIDLIPLIDLDPDIAGVQRVRDVTPGTTVTVDLHVKNARRMTGFRVEIIFDPSKIQLRDVTLNDLFSNGSDILSAQKDLDETNIDGILAWEGIRLTDPPEIEPISGFTGSGAIMTLELDVLTSETAFISPSIFWATDNRPAFYTDKVEGNSLPSAFNSPIEPGPPTPTPLPTATPFPENLCNWDFKTPISGSVVFDCDLIVPENETLIIEPGAQIKFLAKTDISGGGFDSERPELIVFGKLIADAGIGETISFSMITPLATSTATPTGVSDPTKTPVSTPTPRPTSTFTPTNTPTPTTPPGSTTKAYVANEGQAGETISRIFSVNVDDRQVTEISLGGEISKGELYLSPNRSVLVSLNLGSITLISTISDQIILTLTDDITNPTEVIINDASPAAVFIYDASDSNIIAYNIGTTMTTILSDLGDSSGSITISDQEPFTLYMKNSLGVKYWDFQDIFDGDDGNNDGTQITFNDIPRDIGANGNFLKLPIK